MPDARARGAVFLVTDYGTADEFAGVLHAVVARLAPDAPVVDLTHDVPQFDVRGGALVLRRAVPQLGPGVVVGVVDPGVGTARRAVALETAAAGGPRYLVGPDNGLLPWAADALGGAEAAVALPVPDGSSATFDGRDVFAPAGAALWRGAPLDDLGPSVPVGGLVRLPAPRCEAAPGRLEAEVLWIDRFGNVQLAGTPADLARAGLDGEPRLALAAADRTVPLRVVRAFADLAPGPGNGGRRDDEPSLGLLVDANGHLAVVCDRRPAATVLGVHAGDTVTLRAGERAGP